MRFISAAILCLAVASPAFATKTQFFKHADRAAFETGTLSNVVPTNFGELRLSRAIESVMKDEGKFASIDAIAEGTDGTIYFGTTASGKVMTLVDGKTAELADFGEAAGVSAIAVTAGGDVIVGVSGERAEVQIRRKGDTTLSRLLQLPEGVQYIWSIALAADGKLYLGTGPDGQLFEVSADGKDAKVIFDSEEDNLRAMAILNDTIYVGTDPNGLILKVDRGSGKAFVIYDAPETEISALLVDSRGGQIYAATSQLVEAAGEAEAAAAGGRPNGANATTLIASEPVKEPKPGSDHGDGEAELATAAKASSPTLAAADDAVTEGPTTHAANEPADSMAGPRAAMEMNEGAVEAEAAANGNAVYRIEPQGFVSEVFRDQTMIFGLARQDDQLFIATGPKGIVYQLDLASEEHTAIAKLRPTEVTAILSTNDNRLILGTGGGSAEASTLTASLAKEGSFVSPVLDATQISQFGKLQVLGAIPDSTTLTVSARSGNVSDEESPLWSEWSAATPAARYTAVAVPAARYAQYKLAFAGSGEKSPSVDAVEFAYLQPNIAPRIDSVTVGNAATATDEKSGEVTADPHRSIEWSSTEPNGDDLRFRVSVREARSKAPWTTIAKDLTEASYQWDTRRVSDGRYEVKVEASDALANAGGTGKTASRVAEAMTVDNTPPMIGDVTIEHARGNVTINLRAADKGGIIAGLQYAIDEQDHWQSVPPSDMLDDSPDEQYAIVLPEAGPATRVVSLRCVDENGNTAHESVTVRPEK